MPGYKDVDMYVGMYVCMSVCTEYRERNAVHKWVANYDDNKNKSGAFAALLPGSFSRSTS